MGWFFRTSKNGIHAVYSQQAEESCGIACVIMVNFKLKKWGLASSAIEAVSAGPISATITAPIGRRTLRRMRKRSQGRPLGGSADFYSFENSIRQIWATY